MTKVKISRFDSVIETTPHLQEYIVPTEERGSVLQALLYIYEEVDSTLAFRFGCRFKWCGLCSMDINGKPRLACLTGLEEEMVLEPLRHLPILRDLVIDRSLFYERVKSLQLHIPFDDRIMTPQTIFEPKEHQPLGKMFRMPHLLG